MAPLAAQKAAFEKDNRANSGPVVKRGPLNIEHRSRLTLIHKTAIGLASCGTK
jgi:hypothetical protein